MNETTLDLLDRSIYIMRLAKQVKDRDSHVKFWNEKVELWNETNSALETGYYTGDARTDLLTVKSRILSAESIAGQLARQNY